MAPLKKPLFVPPPPATLHHFFAKADASINRNASSSSFQAPKRVKAGSSSSQIKLKATTHTPQPAAEIIVLDSDDDAPVVRAKRKAKDHVESSSDVEVVETDAQQTHGVSSSGKKAKTGRGAGFGGSGTECLLAFPQDESLHFAEFGRPKLLVPTEDTQHSAEDEKSPASFPRDKSSVPASAPLSADLGVSVRPFIDGSSRFFATTSTTHLENLIEIDDEWGTGDDELVHTNKGEFDDVLELTDDDEVGDVLKVEDEPPSASGDNNLDECPFCGRSLTSFAPLVSLLLQSTAMSSHVSRIRTYNHTSMTAATPFLVRFLHRVHLSLPTARLRHHGSLNAKNSLIATRSRSSCPRARQTPRWLRTAASARQKRTVGEEKNRSTSSKPDLASSRHAHSDHYTSLSSTWQAGPIYCSGKFRGFACQS